MHRSFVGYITGVSLKIFLCLNGKTWEPYLAMPPIQSDIGFDVMSGHKKYMRVYMQKWPRLYFESPLAFHIRKLSYVCGSRSFFMENGGRAKKWNFPFSSLSLKAVHDQIYIIIGRVIIIIFRIYCLMRAREKNRASNLEK